MPIKGLTDRMPQFPNIGVLRKGGAKENEKKPGPDLTYLRFTSQVPEVADAFRQIYGDQPRDIEVLLPYAKAEDNFQAWREAWVAGGLQHRCDGETCSIWLDGKKYNTTPKPCPGGCKPVGRLMVIIPQLKRFAYVTVLTTSLHDIIQISQNLADAELKARGDLRGIPFIISRRARMVSTPGTDGARVRREKWLLSIEPHPRWVAAMLVDLQRQAMPMIEAPAEDEADDSTVGTVINTQTGEIVEGKSKPAEPHASEGRQQPAGNGNGKRSDAETEAERQARETERRKIAFDILKENVPVAKALGINTKPFAAGSGSTTDHAAKQAERLLKAIAQAQAAQAQAAQNQPAGEVAEGEFTKEVPF